MILKGCDRPLQIRAVIPHYFSESSDPVQEIGAGFGSRKKGARLLRAAAFQRCLHGLMNLRCSPCDWLLDLRTAKGIKTPPLRINSGYSSIDVEIVVAIAGDKLLFEVIENVLPQAKLLSFDIDDPRKLGLKARDWLLKHPSPADLNLYLEDDLVIHDKLLPEKIIWMAVQSDYKCVLFPHRYELTRRPGSYPRLYIDGPIDQEELSGWHSPKENFASGYFKGRDYISFDVPINPHSGFFGLTREQVLLLKSHSLPLDGFVGPLETAATYTVGSSFTILKPALSLRTFLEIEHAFPSYLGYLK